MNNSTIQGLTKQEETLFWSLVNKILAQSLLPEASSNSTEKQLQLNFKVDENGLIDVDSIELQLVQIKSLSLFEKSSTSTEKKLELNVKVDENSSKEIESIESKLEQPKPPLQITSIIFYVISFAAFILGFVVTPGIIIWILTNSIIFTTFALIGWVVCIGIIAVGLFNGKTNWGVIGSGFTGLFIIILLAIFL